MRKILSLVLALGLCLALLAGCTQTQPLPEGLDAQTLESESKAILDVFNERDWDTLNAYFPDAGLKSDDWADSLDPVLDELGGFKSVDRIVTTGYNDENAGVEYGFVYLTCTYENGKKTFQVTFSAAGDLVGFHIVA